MCLCVCLYLSVCICTCVYMWGEGENTPCRVHMGGSSHGGRGVTWGEHTPGYMGRVHGQEMEDLIDAWCLHGGHMEVTWVPHVACQTRICDGY